MNKILVNLVQNSNEFSFVHRPYRTVINDLNSNYTIIHDSTILEKLLNIIRIARIKFLKINENTLKTPKTIWAFLYSNLNKSHIYFYKTKPSFTQIKINLNFHQMSNSITKFYRRFSYNHHKLSKQSILSLDNTVNTINNILTTIENKRSFVIIKEIKYGT